MPLACRVRADAAFAPRAPARCRYVAGAAATLITVAAADVIFITLDCPVIAADAMPLPLPFSIAPLFRR
jgi:hypothetical protein